MATKTAAIQYVVIVLAIATVDFGSSSLALSAAAAMLWVRQWREIKEKNMFSPHSLSLLCQLPHCACCLRNALWALCECGCGVDERACVFCPWKLHNFYPIREWIIVAAYSRCLASPRPLCNIAESAALRNHCSFSHDRQTCANSLRSMH